MKKQRLLIFSVFIGLIIAGTTIGLILNSKQKPQLPVNPDSLKLTITVFPADSKITIDQKAAQNNSTVKIKPGYQKIKLERFGFKTVSLTINARFDGYLAYAMAPVIPETKEWTKGQSSAVTESLNNVEKQTSLVEGFAEQLFPIVKHFDGVQNNCVVVGNPNLYNVLNIYFKGDIESCKKAYKKLAERFPMDEYDTFLINNRLIDETEIWRP